MATTRKAAVKKKSAAKKSPPKRKQATRKKAPARKAGVNKKKTVTKSKVAKQARQAVLDRHPEVMDVIVHVEPTDRFRSETAEMKKNK